MVAPAIEYHEDRDVATINISGAYLHTENDKYVIMLLRGRLAELMSMVEPKIYQKYVTIDQNRKTFLYVKVLKVLYGILKSVLLFIIILSNIWKLMDSRPIHIIHA